MKLSLRNKERKKYFNERERQQTGSLRWFKFNAGFYCLIKWILFRTWKVVLLCESRLMEMVPAQREKSMSNFYSTPASKKNTNIKKRDRFRKILLTLRQKAPKVPPVSQWIVNLRSDSPLFQNRIVHFSKETKNASALLTEDFFLRLWIRFSFRFEIRDENMYVFHDYD